MRKKRWVGLRSANFRRTIVIFGIILALGVGFSIGRYQLNQRTKTLQVMEKQVEILESQLNEIKLKIKN
ncbi:MAG TPA: hypothetical protein VNT57_01340 [Desulfobacteria bacterium]|nr:hypothetical protein [Desulfobacteria bacterium]